MKIQFNQYRVMPWRSMHMLRNGDPVKQTGFFIARFREGGGYDISIDSARHSFCTGMVCTRKRGSKGEQAYGDYHPPG